VGSGVAVEVGAGVGVEVGGMGVSVGRLVAAATACVPSSSVTALKVGVVACQTGTARVPQPANIILRNPQASGRILPAIAVFQYNLIIQPIHCHSRNWSFMPDLQHHHKS